jgi:surface polysaccharide O-acyltransferase-like enzyme
MNSYLSEKLKILSAISILLVLYIHSGFHADEIDGMAFNGYVQEMISNMIGRCAVPLFYIISGYLFFYKVPNGMRSIFEKMKKRVRTLLIPYIIAAVFFVVFFLVIELIPGTSKFMNGNIRPVFAKDWSTILVSVFYDAGNGSPLAFQLWFLRDLIILVAFSPIWYLLFKYLKGWWVLIVLVLNYFSISYFPIYALFWFSLGGFLIKVNLCNTSLKSGGVILTVLFLTLCFLQLLYPALLWKFVKIPIILLGVVSFWFMYDIFVSPSFSLQNHSWLNKVCGFTFFIYLFHEPTLNIVRKLIVFVLGKNEIGYLVSYLMSPWIFIVFAVFVGLGLKKQVPKLYEITVGGR